MQAGHLAPAFGRPDIVAAMAQEVHDRPGDDKVLVRDGIRVAPPLTPDRSPSLASAGLLAGEVVLEEQ